MHTLDLHGMASLMLRHAKEALPCKLSSSQLAGSLTDKHVRFGAPGEGYDAASPRKCCPSCLLSCNVHNCIKLRAGPSASFALGLGFRRGLTRVPAACQAVELLLQAPLYWTVLGYFDKCATGSEPLALVSRRDFVHVSCEHALLNCHCS